MTAPESPGAEKGQCCFSWGKLAMSTEVYLLWKRVEDSSLGRSVPHLKHLLAVCVELLRLTYIVLCRDTRGLKKSMVPILVTHGHRVVETCIGQSRPERGCHLREHHSRLRLERLDEMKTY